MCSYITLHLRISQAASYTFVLWCLSPLVKETGNAPKLASTFQDCCKKDWCAVAVWTWGHVLVAITPDVLQTVISETRNGLLPLAILWREQAIKHVGRGQIAEKIIDLPRAQINDQKVIFSSIPLSNSSCSRLGPSRGFFSWRSTLQGPSTRLVLCFWNYRETRTTVRRAGLGADVSGR